MPPANSFEMHPGRIERSIETVFLVLCNPIDHEAENVDHPRLQPVKSLLPASVSNLFFREYHAPAPGSSKRGSRRAKISSTSLAMARAMTFKRTPSSTLLAMSSFLSDSAIDRTEFAKYPISV